MPRLQRGKLVDPEQCGIFHCYNRCVQKAYLCGYDKATKKDYSDRKPWILERLRQLCGVFLIDVFKVAVMDNHLHLLARTRPDLVRTMTDAEVLLRWEQLCPSRRAADGSIPPPKRAELKKQLRSQERVAELRKRLSSISWLMRMWCQYIAQRSNQETKNEGAFFASRFKCQAILDDAAALACAMYIDLNPIRAGKSKTPEESEYTSVHERITGRRQRQKRASQAGARLPEDGGLWLDTAFASPADADAWLAPLTLDPEQRLQKLFSRWSEPDEKIEWMDITTDDRQRQQLLLRLLSSDQTQVAQSVLNALTQSEDPSLAMAEISTAGEHSLAAPAARALEQEVKKLTAMLAADAIDTPDFSGQPASSTPTETESIRGNASQAGHEQVAGTPATPQQRERQRERRRRQLRTKLRRLLRAANMERFPARRASDRGFLATTLDEYLKLLDWTGRQLRRGKRGAIPKRLPPILERLGIQSSSWLNLMKNLPKLFHNAVGSTKRLREFAAQVGRRWLQGHQASGSSFT